jgi:predicted  nucleic acid-binding Zn-ribbon protein
MPHTCSRCGDALPAERKDRYCRECRRAYQAAYHAKNKEAINAQRRVLRAHKKRKLRRRRDFRRMRREGPPLDPWTRRQHHAESVKLWRGAHKSLTNRKKRRYRTKHPETRGATREGKVRDARPVASISYAPGSLTRAPAWVVFDEQNASGRPVYRTEISESDAVRWTHERGYRLQGNGEEENA